MPSTPRSAILGDDCYFHVTWQCHNKDWLLAEPWAKQLYYNLLCRYKDRYGVTIYAYCLMDNHPHLCGHLANREQFSDFFRVVNSLFAKQYNKRVERRGQVVMDRFRSPCVQTDTDLLRLMRYIDLNPLRAGKVDHPKRNEWSSYLFYAHGIADPLLTPAPSYLALAATPIERRRLYRGMVAELLRHNRNRRERYSTALFIGQPDWVAYKYAALQAERVSRRAAWRARFRERYGQLASRPQLNGLP